MRASVRLSFEVAHNDLYDMKRHASRALVQDRAPPL